MTDAIFLLRTGWTDRDLEQADNKTVEQMKILLNAEATASQMRHNGSS